MPFFVRAKPIQRFVLCPFKFELGMIRLPRNNLMHVLDVHSQAIGFFRVLAERIASSKSETTTSIGSKVLPPRSGSLVSRQLSASR